MTEGRYQSSPVQEGGYVGGVVLAVGGEKSKNLSLMKSMILPKKSVKSKENENVG